MNGSPCPSKGRKDWRAFYRREAMEYEASRYGGRYGGLFKELHRDTLTGFLSSSHAANVLDVAAGTGHVTELLASLGFNLTSIDLTEEMLMAARVRIRNKGLKSAFILGNAFTLPFADATFQIVVSTRFLHLWPQAQQSSLIREMVRVLKPGGMLIVDFDNWWHRTILCIPIFIYQRVLGRGRVVEEHYSRLKQTNAIIRAAGVRIMDIRGIGGYPLVLLLLISHRMALATGRMIGRTALHRLFSEQFMIRGEKQ
jgi:2-polyprenyl-3-methyl-5-hydroxy-6-metoxy-1,4-benzoquinol methylase